MRFGVAVAVGLAGCGSVHAVGVVEPLGDRPGVRVVTMEGDRYRLNTAGAAAPLAYLDGHMVDVRGPFVLGRLRPTEWTVIEGRHGLQTWVGVLQTKGIQIGMNDHNSGSWYFLDEEGAAVVRPYVGLPVLVEGWVEGGHRVKVAFFRVLTADGDER